MQITVKTLTGKAIPLEVQATDTLESVREKIEYKEGIPIMAQRLVFAGRELKHEENVFRCDELSIVEGSTLHLVLCLRR
ncbi:ubiquitin-related domain-containing protein [Mortierella sp. GBAus27b]|nr:ubiquitin-related domain-containing protein [Mortierella sp. GBAus27b]